MAQIQGNDLHPVARWVNGLRDLGRQALHLLHPLVCSAMASFSVAAIAVSPTFRTLGRQVQVAVLSGLGMYTVMCGCIAFGTWSTNRVVNTETRANRLLVAAFRFVTLGIIVFIASVTVFAQDYLLALGAGTLAIQSQFLSHHQGYNIASSSMVVGILSIGAMVVVREFNIVFLGFIMIVIAGILFSCN